MAATPVGLRSTLSSHDSPPRASVFHVTMASTLYAFLFLTFSILVFTLYTILKHYSIGNGSKREGDSIKIQSSSADEGDEIAQQQKQETVSKPDTENLARSLLLEMLPSSSPKWDSVFGEVEYVDIDDDLSQKTGSGQEDKKRKKRARKKKPGPNEEERKDKEELVCLYPFTKSCSATQRKIKQHYDQLVKSHPMDQKN